MATQKTTGSRSSGAAEKSSGTKSPAKKSAAKKGGAEKSTAKKGSAQKRPAQRAAARAEAPQRRSGSQIAGDAVRQLAELTGRQPEGVTGLERTDDGWTVSVDVLELRRVPETTDVLACYEVEIDSGGDLLGYRRVHRYVRGAAGEESP